MICVLDTNILISALIRDSITRRILVESQMEFHYPEMSLNELRKHRALILEKSGLSSSMLDDMVGRILAQVVLMPDEESKRALPEAKAVMADIDPDDAVFIAAALVLKDAVIWSDDAHLRRQSAVRVISTKEAMVLFL